MRPAYRRKVASLGSTGKLVATDYQLSPRVRRQSGSRRRAVRKNHVELVAIGSSTASRETEHASYLDVPEQFPNVTARK